MQGKSITYIIYDGNALITDRHFRVLFSLSDEFAARSLTPSPLALRANQILIWVKTKSKDGYVEIEKGNRLREGPFDGMGRFYGCLR